MLKQLKDTQQKLSAEIHNHRIRMYKKAEMHGFAHPEVIECSQKLDHLLNRFEKYNTNSSI